MTVSAAYIGSPGNQDRPMRCDTDCTEVVGTAATSSPWLRSACRSPSRYALKECNMLNRSPWEYDHSHNCLYDKRNQSAHGFGSMLDVSCQDLSTLSRKKSSISHKNVWSLRKTSTRRPVIDNDDSWTKYPGFHDFWWTQKTNHRIHSLQSYSINDR